MSAGEKTGVPFHSPGTDLKQMLQRGLRKVHVVCARQEFPERMALYLHSLDESERPALREMLSWCVDEGRTLWTPGGISRRTVLPER